MAWFSVWLPLFLQVIVPMCLLTGCALSPRASRATFVAVGMLTAAYLAAVHLAGLWVVLPWYTAVVYGAALIVVIIAIRPRFIAAPLWPTSRATQVSTIAASFAALSLTALAGVAVSARRAPAHAVDLAFPFAEGVYLVVNGGSHVLVNAHLNTLEGARFAPYRGQSYGVDLVRLDSLGLRATGLLPTDLAAYRIFGEPVLAPCAGHVVAAVDGFADMTPPQMDRAHLAGNSVILDCDGAWVVLGHFQRGSVDAHAGHRVEVGQRIGRVGNSGNTGEPHLHLHAQRPGTEAAPLGGDPLPVRIAGRFATRNDRLAMAAGTP